MNITVRVQSARAQREIDYLRARIRELEAQIGRTNAAASMMTIGGVGGLARWGSQVQWAGRQLFHNFTVPIGIAAVASARFALENERAMIRVQKVYGDSSLSAQQLDKDMKALNETADYMSVRFGVAREVVLQIAGDWAAAGATGEALGRAMDVTLSAMVLGEMEAQEATEALIATQAQYGTNIEGLTDILYKLNITENETGITLNGLIQGFQRAAGVARTSGVDVNHLAAMLASLTPAAGSATQAGNGLRTIISRIMAPTAAAERQFEELGVDIDSAAWASQNATQRIETLAAAVSTLDGATPGFKSSRVTQILSDIGSRWQVNRLDVLFRDVAASMNEGSEAAGFYGRTLRSLTDEQYVYKKSMQELNTVLDSNPKAVDRAGVVIKNSMIKVIASLMPQILWLVNSIATLTQKFANMNPAVQKLILSFLLFLAILGPPLMVLGSLAVAVGRVAQMMTFLKAGVTKIFHPLAALRGLLGRGKNLTGPNTPTGAMRTLAATSTTTASTVNAAMQTVNTSMASTATVSSAATANSASSWSRFAGWMGTTAARVGGFFASMDYSARNFTINSQFAASTSASAAAGMASGWWGAATTTSGAATAMSSAISTAVATMTGSALAAGRAIPAAFGTAMAETTSYVRYAGTYMASQFGAAMGTAVAMAYAIGIRVGHAFVAGLNFTWAELWRAIMAYFGVFTAQITAGASVAARAAWGVGVRVGHNVVAGLWFSWAELWAAIMAYFGVFTAQITAAGTGAAVAAFRAGATAGGAYAAGWVTMVPVAITAGATVGRAAGSSLAIGTGAGFVAASRGIWARIWAFIKAGFVALFGAKGIGSIFKKGAFAGITSMLLTVGKFIFSLFTRPWVLGISAVLLLLGFFRDQISQLFENIGEAFQDMPAGFHVIAKAAVNIWVNAITALRDAFYKLPEGVQDSLERVADLVYRAAMKVYEFFSYMNPFARHSPSLVENVTAGMRAVGDQFGLASARIRGYLLSSYEAINRFGRATAGLMVTQRDIQRAEDRALLGKHAGTGAVAAYDEMQRVLEGLETQYDAVGAAIERQEATVDLAKRTLDGYKASAEAAESVLTSLKDRATELAQAISEGNEKIDTLSRAPIVGMRAMEGAIFDNEMAQKRLNLEILKMGKGANTEDLAARVAALRGEIEVLRGIQNDLRAGGADYTILRVYDQQIKELEAQQRTIEASTDPISALEKQLEELQRQGEIMDLEYALKFDPLRREIEDLIDTTEELTFQEIIDGIKEQQKKLGPLEDQLDDVNDEIKRQEEVVKRANIAVDNAQRVYDAHRQTLEDLQGVYDGINERIGALEEELNLGLTAAREYEAALKAAADAAEDLADTSGMFPEVGGIPNFEEGDLDAWLDEYMKQFGDIFEDFDMWGPFKEKWEAFKKWWNENITPFWDGIKMTFAELFDGIDWSEPLRNLGTQIGDWWQTNIIDPFDWGGFATEFIEDFRTNVLEAFEEVKKVWEDNFPQLKEEWDDLKATLDEIGIDIDSVGEAIGILIKIIFGTLGGLLLWAVNNITNVLSNVADDVVRIVMGIGIILIGTVNGIIQIVSGLFEVFAGLFTGDRERAYQGSLSILNGITEIGTSLFEGVGEVGTGLFGLYGGVLIGLAEGVEDTANQISALVGSDWRMEVVGSFEDVFNGAVEWLGRLPETVTGFFEQMVEGAIEWARGLWDELVGHSIFPDIYFDIMYWIRMLPIGVINEFIKMKNGAIAWALSMWMGLVGPDGWISRTYRDIIGWLDGLPATIEGIFNSLRTKIWNVGAGIFADMVGKDSWFSKLFYGARDWATDMKNVIGTAWDGVKGKFAVPIDWVISKVWNGGVVSVFNSASKALGSKTRLDPIPPIAKRKRGGYTPPGMTLVGEEGPELLDLRKPGRVYTAAQTRAMLDYQAGRTPDDEAMKAATGSRSSQSLLPQGGTWDDVGSIASGAWQKIQQVSAGALQWIRGTLAKSAEFVIAPLRNLVNQAPLKGAMGEVGKAMARKGLGMTTDWVKGKDREFPAAEALNEYLDMLPTSGGWQRPSAGPITSRFGPRWGTLHAGIDIAGGGKTFAAKAGQVVRAGWNILTGRTGIGIALAHGGQEYSYYGHNPVGGVQVKVGDIVKRGQHIGYQGATGNVTGTHLHFEYHKGGIGRAVNPETLGIFDNGGLLKPGMLGMNLGNKGEPVLTAPQWADIHRLAKRAMTNESINESNGTTSVVYNDRSNKTVYVTIEHVEFPNIREPEDAENFVRNLEMIAR